MNITGITDNGDGTYSIVFDAPATWNGDTGPSPFILMQTAAGTWLPTKISSQDDPSTLTIAPQDDSTGCTFLIIWAESPWIVTNPPFEHVQTDSGIS